MPAKTIKPEICKNGKVLKLLLEIPVNGSFEVGVYQGTLSKFDMLIKYRQKDSKGKWSYVRTPKHIHWAVDILIKMNEEPKTTKKFLDFLIDYWDKNIQSIGSKSEQDSFLDLPKLQKEVDTESKKCPNLAGKDEYSVKFLILLAELLMTQEKTNMPGAYMFKDLLPQLKDGNDIYKKVSTASHGRR
jgi:hypothetical protein